ncbi:MAG: SMC family ATPase [Promethearchaeati archaeon SRVP18_Atabeyarchaeia-1]
MRLLTIRVHNFRCFKEAELNLRGLESVTVVGANGAGKSTLVIDALTWCIYGRTSVTDFKGYKQEDLVRVGSKECYVEIEFELGGDIYNVKRTYNTTRKATFLDVSVNKRRLDLKVKDAERFLTERIGLDYEGFVNSTIIRQEEMKRLIAEDPSRRKDIFISLFRLGIYEEALQKTKEGRVEAETKLAEINRSLEAKEEFLAQEKNWLDKRKELDPLIKETEKKKAETETSLHALELSVSELENNVNKFIVAETKSKLVEVRVKDTQSKLLDNRSALSKSQEQLGNYVEKANEAERLRKEYESMSALRDEYVKVTNQKEVLEKLVRIRLDQEKEAISRLREEQEELLNEKESLSRQNDERSSGPSVSVLTRKHKESIDRLEETATEFGRLERDLEAAKIATHDRGKLTELKKVAVEKRQKLSTTRKIVNETLDDLVTELPKLSTFEVKFDAITKQTAEACKALSERQSSLNEQTLMVGEIDGKGPVNLRDANKSLEEYGAKIGYLAESGYDPVRYDRLRQKVGEGISAREELAKIKQSVSTLERTVESLTEEHRILTEEYGRLEKELESTKPIKEEYQNTRGRLSTTQKQFADLSKELDGLKGRREEIQANLENIMSYKSTIKDLLSKQKELEYEISDYNRLESVFHRDGIPSVILRRIVPRVASEASSILAQLSDGRYDAITIEEQEDGRLNIWVKDGESRYGVQRFSGGEKVRIALAVRLAVSKVLSELPEAGKRLSKMRTLVIDEGDLGSLDGEGVNSTIDIIQELTKLFGLTILISHLDAVKGWAGGNYAIVHRGEGGASSTVEYS